MMPQVRNLLGAFLFRGDEVYKSLSVLSGGERSRLALVKLLLEPANLLILDEPTNHLDMSSKDVLLDALKSFSGTVVFVSHDRRFISELADRVVELSRPHERAQTAVRNFPGDYEYYLWRLEQEASHASAEAGAGEHAAVSAGVEYAREHARDHGGANGDGSRRSASGPSRSGGYGRTGQGSGGSRGGGDHQQLKQRRNALQKIKRQEETLMSRIEELDTEHQRLQALLADPEVYADGERIREVKDQLQRCESEQEKLTEEWQELEEQRSTLETEQ
jgi:ATP-binding cassette subfamily F protein 3